MTVPAQIGITCQNLKWTSCVLHYGMDWLMCLGGTYYKEVLQHAKYLQKPSFLEWTATDAVLDMTDAFGIV